MSTYHLARSKLFVLTQQFSRANPTWYVNKRENQNTHCLRAAHRTQMLAILRYLLSVKIRFWRLKIRINDTIIHTFVFMENCSVYSQLRIIRTYHRPCTVFSHPFISHRLQNTQKTSAPVKPIQLFICISFS